MASPEASRSPDLGSAGFLRRLLGNLPGMAYRCKNDRDWTMEFVSDGCRELTGFEPRDLEASRVVAFADLIHPDDRTRVQAEVDRGLNADLTFKMTYRIRRADGALRWVWEQGVGVRNAGGGVEALEGFITDVTEQQELSQRLKSSEQRFRSFFEQSLAGVYTIRDGRLGYVNPRFAEIFGYRLAEILELDSVLDLVHPDDRSRVGEQIRKRLEGEIADARYEFRGVRKDGSICEVEVHGRSIEVSGKTVVMGLLLDISERSIMRRRYHQMEKLEAVGRVASGIAHDFNNVLTVIRMTAQLLHNQCEEGSELANDLKEILDSAEYGGSLSRELMRFGRDEPTETKVLSLSTSIVELKPVLERVLGSDIRLLVEADSEVPLIEISPTQLEQVLMNLVTNAQDAMTRGGDLTIRTSRQSTGPRQGHSAHHERPHAVLHVEDTGCGIEAEILDRIFEPYFTTKNDKGTGLGLGNVWRIAVECGGAVEVTSTVGKGTEFRVFFPSVGD